MLVSCHFQNNFPVIPAKFFLKNIVKDDSLNSYINCYQMMNEICFISNYNSRNSNN